MYLALEALTHTVVSKGRRNLADNNSNPLLATDQLRVLVVDSKHRRC
jgi:hypothetical protein